MSGTDWIEGNDFAVSLWCGWFGGLDAVGLLAQPTTLATLAAKRNAPANLAQGALVLLALSLHFHLRLPSAYHRLRRVAQPTPATSSRAARAPRQRARTSVVVLLGAWVPNRPRITP